MRIESLFLMIILLWSPFLSRVLANFLFLNLMLFELCSFFSLFHYFFSWYFLNLNHWGYLSFSRNQVLPHSLKGFFVLLLAKSFNFFFTNQLNFMSNPYKMLVRGNFRWFFLKFFWYFSLIWTLFIV